MTITGAVRGERRTLAVRFEGARPPATTGATIAGLAGYPAATGRIMAGADEAAYWETIAQGPRWQRGARRSA